MPVQPRFERFDWIRTRACQLVWSGCSRQCAHVAPTSSGQVARTARAWESPDGVACAQTGAAQRLRQRRL